MGRAVILVVMSYFEGFAAAVSASRAQATAAGISGGSGQAPEIRLLSEGEGRTRYAGVPDSVAMGRQAKVREGGVSG